MRIAAIAMVAAFFGGPALAAEALPAATGKVILTVDGKIGVRNGNRGADFDRSMIEALPSTVGQNDDPLARSRD